MVVELLSVELLAVELSAEAVLLSVVASVLAGSAVTVAVAVTSAEAASYLRAEWPAFIRANIYESTADFALTAELNFLTGAAESTLRPWAVNIARAETIKNFINQILK